MPEGHLHSIVQSNILFSKIKDKKANEKKQQLHKTENKNKIILPEI